MEESRIYNEDALSYKILRLTIIKEKNEKQIEELKKKLYEVEGEIQYLKEEKIKKEERKKYSLRKRKLEESNNTFKYSKK